MELLSWLNSLLETDYTKIDHLGDGVAYLQVLDAVYPNSVPLHKLDFGAKSEQARLKNLRLLQRTLTQLGIKKEIPVKRMAKCKFADNVEMLQWCYQFISRTYPDSNTQYRAQERRQQARMLAATGKSKKRRQTAENPDLIPSNLLNNSLRPGLTKSPPRDAILGGDGSSPLLEGNVASSLLNSRIPVSESFYSNLHNPVDSESSETLFDGASVNETEGSDPQHYSTEYLQTRIASRLAEAGSPAHPAELLERLNKAIFQSSSSSPPGPPPSPPLENKKPGVHSQTALLQMQRHVEQRERRLTHEVLAQRSLEDEVESVRIERDFYFDTLRAIETSLESTMQRNPELASTKIAQDLVEILQRKDARFLSVDIDIDKERYSE